MYHSQQLRVTLRQNWLSSTNPFNIRKLRHERRKYDASKPLSSYLDLVCNEVQGTIFEKVTKNQQNP